jgi:hypothetical protein
MQPSPRDPEVGKKGPNDPKPRAAHEQVRKFLNFIVNESSEELCEISGANKRKISGEILADVLENIENREPILAVRRRLANYATLAVRDEVLSMTPAATHIPEITGMLRSRLPDLAARNPAIGEFLGKGAGQPQTADQMADLLRARGIVFNLWARSYNVARMELGDWDEDKKVDWFAPFKLAQAITCEFAYRKELGMPSNIPSPHELTEGSGEFMVYADFLKIILEGNAKPRPAWEARWEAALKYPNPFKGLEL